MPDSLAPRTRALALRSRRGAMIALASTAIGITALFSTTGCGLLPPDRYTIRVDSLTVTPGAAAGQVSIRAHGLAGSNGCGGLDRVEREARGDTAIRRFIGVQRNGNCLQMPTRLEHTEEVTLAPGRTLRYVVRQPDGPALVRDIAR